MEIKPFNIRFFLKQNRGKSSSQHTLYARILLAEERADISLKIEVPRESWDEKLQRLKGRSSDNVRLLTLMNQYRQRALNIYQELIQCGKSPAIGEIRQRLTGKAKAESVYPRFLELFDKAITRKEALAGKNNTAATIQKYKRCRAHLSAFIESTYQKSDLRFDEVKLAFIEDFEVYLKVKSRCGHNSTMKYLQVTKTIFKHACAHGYVRHDPFVNFKIHMEEVIRECLTQEEIDRLIETDLPTEKLRRVRDFFVFSCYTGLAYADIHGLRAKHIHFEQGQAWIRTMRQKTRVRTNVPLLAIPMQLIEKYNETTLNALAPETPVFKVMSNQKINDYLKIIATFCHISKPLTFHIARHTFATTITLSNGVPIESVSAMLGHKRISTTQHYARMIDKKLEEDMKILGSRLQQQSSLSLKS